MHTHHKAREITNKVLEMIAEGVLDRDHVISSALQYLSEDQVRDMAESEGWVTLEHDDLDKDQG